MGAGSRQEVKSYIRKGMVSVNGETVSRPETKIDEEKDEIFLQGKRIAYAAFEYYMLNKPAGVISATEDKKENYGGGSYQREEAKGSVSCRKA